jgi:hypothetical protein
MSLGRELIHLQLIYHNTSAYFKIGTCWDRTENTNTKIEHDYKGKNVKYDLNKYTDNNIQSQIFMLKFDYLVLRVVLH